jgi:alpha-tubulin suppressor-like RCC1 family protein
MSRPNQFLSPEGDLEDYFVDEYWLIDQYVGDTLWVWGGNNSNQSGSLGDNTSVSRSTPVTTIAGGANWKSVAVGYGHKFGIKTDGTLWGWGADYDAMLGTNASNLLARSTPVTTFAGGTDWKQVSCGYYFSAAIKTDGTLWTWGANTAGQLGINSTIKKCTPVTTFAGGNNWKQLSCGYARIAAIKTDGTLWTWGVGNSGEMGSNTAIDRSTPVTTFAGGTNWKQVACGTYHTAAIKTDGTLWTWGSNFASLGDNTVINRSTPVTTFAGGTNWKQVACGFSYTAAIKTDGTLWGWGNNSNGQLGDNTSTSRSTPVTTFVGGTNWKQVAASNSSYHTAAIKTDGTLWAWGDNGFSGSGGMIGDNTISSRLTPVTTFAGGSNWKQVFVGRSQTAAVTSGTDPTYFIS